MVVSPATFGVRHLARIAYNTAPHGRIKPARQALSHRKIGAELRPNVVSRETAFGACNNRNSRVNGLLLVGRPLNVGDILADTHCDAERRKRLADDLTVPAEADGRREKLGLRVHNSPPNSMIAWLSTLS